LHSFINAFNAVFENTAFFFCLTFNQSSNISGSQSKSNKTFLNSFFVKFLGLAPLLLLVVLLLVVLLFIVLSLTFLLSAVNVFVIGDLQF